MGLPSSFEGRDGHVRYLVKCKIDKPWKFDHNTKCPFTIISILDLNQIPQSSQMLQGVKDKTVCCWCCTSGKIHVSFHIDRQGYVPGEAIKLYAEISNGSNRRVKSSVSLKMVTRFHATTSTNTEITVVAGVNRPEISAHSEDVWSGEQLVIPPLPPSYLVGCKIIDIKYILQLTVNPSGPSLKLEIPLEIIIGTIPLASVVQQFLPSPPPAPIGFGNWTSTSAPLDVIYPPALQNGWPDLAPPSYNECITGRVNICDKEDTEFTRGNLDYAPAYTYYNWGNTPSALPKANI